MSELATLARPYATAVFKRAKQTDTTPQWSETLAFLAAVMQDRQIARAAANPNASREHFTSALLELCRGRLDGEGENLIRLLVANRRLELITIIRNQFEQFRADDEGYIVTDVCTAYPLDDAELDQITTVLQQTLGKQPRLHVQVDETLIGGVLIKAGDRVIDASVRGQIQRLAKTLYN
jgi:F-type H+-transporting ATPase subunit delta